MRRGTPNKSPVIYKPLSPVSSIHPPIPQLPLFLSPTLLYLSASLSPHSPLLYLLARSHPAGSVGIRAAQGTLKGESDFFPLFFHGKNSKAEGGFCQSAQFGGQVVLHRPGHLTGVGWGASEISKKIGFNLTTDARSSVNVDG